MNLFCSIASLLAKFRIDYSALKVISDASKEAQPATKAFFESLIADFLHKDESETADEGIFIFLEEIYYEL